MENGVGQPAKPYDKVAKESGRVNRKMTCWQAFLPNRQHYAEIKTQVLRDLGFLLLFQHIKCLFRNDIANIGDLGIEEGNDSVAGFGVHKD